jgi:sulfur transfer protein SufE
MKAQLKELAIQAKLPGYLLEYGTELCVAPHLEKFAELIVRECASKAWFVEQYGIGDGTPVSKQIKEHFGVEE